MPPRCCGCRLPPKLAGTGTAFRHNWKVAAQCRAAYNASNSLTWDRNNRSSLCIQTDPAWQPTPRLGSIGISEPHGVEMHNGVTAAEQGRSS